MSSLAEVERSLAEFTLRMMPRILSQACRDPDSPTYGTFDRDWWHYRIRDFPSVILQQGGYTVWLASQRNDLAEWRTGLVDLARASAAFWQRRAIRRGAFEEYYPFEEGYPPLAFSTLAIMKLVRDGVVGRQTVERGAARAADQLLDRFESKAANQQVAGLAALALLREQYPHLVAADDFAGIAERTLALQSTEGWFEECGGPDLGYLSVTLDCLWDLVDATGEPRFRAAASRGLTYLHALVDVAGGTIGMHNARNTDYVVPYGLTRFLDGDARERAAATATLVTLFADSKSPRHFLHALDDRYLCHYTGHSLVRACSTLEREAATQSTSNVADRTPDDGRLFPGSGHFLLPASSRRRGGLIASLRKGGITTLFAGGDTVSDFGWRVTTGDHQYVNHWWSSRWTFQHTGDKLYVEGPLVHHPERLASPATHIPLRVASALLGRRLFGPIRERLVFEARPSPFHFRRMITPGRDGFTVDDEIEGVPADAVIERAPRASKRHVASADSFHVEDLNRTGRTRVEESCERSGGRFRATTRYALP